MKKLCYSFLCLVSLQGFGQPADWFISFGMNYTIGGPGLSIKQQMSSQGFDYSAIGWFGSNIEYPDKTNNPSILLRAGKKIGPKSTVFIVAGLSGLGSVECAGRGGGGYVNSISYQIYKFTTGYMYTPPDTRIGLGFGPSILIFHYAVLRGIKTEEHRTNIPAASFTGRFPMGKGKTFVGLEFILETDITGSVDMQAQKTTAEFFWPGKTHLSQVSLGLALTRFKAKKSP